MSESLPDIKPKGTASGILKRKVMGIPLIYIITLFVVLLAAYAYKSKKSSSDAAATAAAPAAGDLGAVTDDESGNPTDGTAVPVLQTGTVYSTGSAVPTPDAGDTTTDTNDLWLTRGIQWAQANGILATDAQTALQAYLNGSDLSYDQGQIVNKVIAQDGPPPTLPTGTKIAAKPAQKQGTPPCTHTVQSTNDAQWVTLATLYYGRNDQATVDLLQGANPQITSNMAFPIGTRVTIPAYHAPKYYTVTSTTRTLAQIASKNGVSQQAITVMNNGKIKFPAAVGTKVRVA